MASGLAPARGGPSRIGRLPPATDRRAAWGPMGSPADVRTLPCECQVPSSCGIRSCGALGLRPAGGPGARAIRWASRCSRPPTTARPSSATSSRSPGPSPRSSGCRSAWASPPSTSAASGSGPACCWATCSSNDYAVAATRHGTGTDVRQRARGAAGDGAAPAPGTRPARRSRASAASSGCWPRSRPATALSATVGSLAQLAGGVIETGALATVWRTWWLGDTTGALVLVPLAIAWCAAAPGELPERRVPEAVLLFVAVVALTELATTTSRPLAYLVFPALIWAALRFGQRGATAAVAFAVGFTVWNAAHYLGAVRLPLRLAHGHQHAAVHRRRRPHDALPRRRRVRAGGVRRERARLPRAHRRGVRDGAPAAAAQPPRRRAAAPHGARRAPAPRRRDAAARERRIGGAARARRHGG